MPASFQREFSATPAGEGFEQLAQELEERTHLLLAFESVYRYVVFLPSKQYQSAPVPNRFFAVGEDGEVKIRGLECRRYDTLANGRAIRVLTVQDEYTRESLALPVDMSFASRRVREPRSVQRVHTTECSRRPVTGSSSHACLGTHFDALMRRYSQR